MTPAGRSITDTMVSVRMVSLVRCDVRVMWMSNGRGAQLHRAVGVVGVED